MIDDQLDVMNNKAYFSRLDLKNGFHHISIAEEFQKYTSFVTLTVQKEFLCTPFGLKTAPSRFQKFVIKNVWNLAENFFTVFLEYFESKNNIPILLAQIYALWNFT